MPKALVDKECIHFSRLVRILARTQDSLREIQYEIIPHKLTKHTGGDRLKEVKETLDHVANDLASIDHNLQRLMSPCTLDKEKAKETI